MARLRRRGETRWEIIVELGRDEHGRRLQRSITVHGTATQARRRLAEVELAEGDGHYRTGGPTVADVVDRYLTHRRGQLAPRTWREYRRLADRHIGPQLGDRPAHQLTTVDVDRFYRRLGRRLGPGSVRQVHAVLRKAYRQAVTWEIVERNPVADATLPPVEQDEVHPPSPAEVGKLVRAAREDCAELGVIVHLAAVTGARRGELAGFQWRDWTRVGSGSVLHVRRAISSGDTAGAPLVVKQTKGRQARKIPLDEATTVLLAEWAERCDQQAAQLGARGGQRYMVTWDPTGRQPAHPDSISTAWERARDRTGLVEYRFHDLRHFAATQMLAAGVPVTTVAYRLGHRDGSVTLRIYGHHVAEVDQAAAELLGRIVGDHL